MIGKRGAISIAVPAAVSSTLNTRMPSGPFEETFVRSACSIFVSADARMLPFFAGQS
jgi:hypothetical protein